MTSRIASRPHHLRRARRPVHLQPHDDGVRIVFAALKQVGWTVHAPGRRLNLAHAALRCTPNPSQTVAALLVGGAGRVRKPAQGSRVHRSQSSPRDWFAPSSKLPPQCPRPWARSTPQRAERLSTIIQMVAPTMAALVRPSLRPPRPKTGCPAGAPRMPCRGTEWHRRCCRHCPPRCGPDRQPTRCPQHAQPYRRAWPAEMRRIPRLWWGWRRLSDRRRLSNRWRCGRSRSGPCAFGLRRAAWVATTSSSINCSMRRCAVPPLPAFRNRPPSSI